MCCCCLWFHSNCVRLTVLPIGTKVTVHKREAGELLLINAAQDIVWHGRQDGVLFGKFGVEIEGVSRVAL